MEVVDIDRDLFMLQIQPDRYDSEKRPIREKFTDEQIRQAIDYFKSLKAKLETTLGDTNLKFIPEPAAIG
jgi:hypothetical protein